MSLKGTDSMGRNTNGNQIEESATEKPLSDAYETVTGVWARGMVDGEVVEGRYLGHDAIKNDDGQLRRRHRFLLKDPAKCSPQAIDGVEVIFGTSALDLDLLAAKLGRMTEVTRIGKASGGREMIVYLVRQAGPVIVEGIIDRDDTPVFDNSGDSGGGGWRGKRSRR